MSFRAGARQLTAAIRSALRAPSGPSATVGRVSSRPDFPPPVAPRQALAHAPNAHRAQRQRDALPPRGPANFAGVADIRMMSSSASPSPTGAMAFAHGLRSPATGAAIPMPAMPDDPALRTRLLDSFVPDAATPQRRNFLPTHPPYPLDAPPARPPLPPRRHSAPAALTSSSAQPASGSRPHPQAPGLAPPIPPKIPLSSPQRPFASPQGRLQASFQAPSPAQRHFRPAAAGNPWVQRAPQASPRPPARVRDGTAQVGPSLFALESTQFRQDVNGMLAQPRVARSRAERQALKSRIGASNRVQDKHMVGDQNFVHRIGGRPVGVMSLDLIGNSEGGVQGVKVHGITTRPDTKHVGSKLLKQAVNFSASHGSRHARVELEFLDGASLAAYEKLGFVRNGSADGDKSNSMYLSPAARPHLWEQSAGRWRLRSQPQARFVG